MSSGFVRAGDVGAPRLALSAPPVEGKANAGVEVVWGSAGRDKTVFVGGISHQEVRGALSDRPG